MANMGRMTEKLLSLTLICCLAAALAATPGGAAGTTASPVASPQAKPEQAQLVFPTSAPASPADNPQARRLKLILASRVKVLAAVNESSQARAKAVLLTLQQACLDTLTELSDNKDPEVRQAAMDLLDKFSLECRVARAMAMLEPAQSQKLRELRGKYPALVAQLLGDNMTARIDALKKLVSMKDPGLAEPLLTMCLWHSYRPLRTAAAEMIADKEYASDELIDALSDIVVEGIRHGLYNGYNGGGNLKSAENFAMQALYRLHPRRAAGKIFAALRVAPIYLSSAPVDLLVQMDEKRLVPVLLANIQSTNRESAWMLDVLLRLTNQSPSEYGIQHDNLNPMMGGGGAFQVENWQKAISKLDEWWKKNKDTHAYRDLKPLPIPKLPALTNPDEGNFVTTDDGEELQDLEEGAAAVVQPAREGADSGNIPGPTATTAPSADADLYDTTGLEAQIRRLVTLCADGLRSERPKERLRAREAILAIQQSILDAIGQAKSESQAHVLPILTALAVRCEMAARLVGMSESDRHKVAQYALHHPLIVEEFFSPVWNQQAHAMAKMQAQSDPMGEAEPLVVMAMKHPWPALRNRAITMTVGKSDTSPSPYHGQAIVDALCDLLASRLVSTSSNSRFFRRARMYPFNNRDDYINEDEILRALRQIRSKRAAPVLLAMMVARSDPFSYLSNFYSDAVLSQTLAATGETRTVPLLVELLQRPDTRMSSMMVDNKIWSFSNRDNILYALLLLTKQTPLDYKMMVRTQGDESDQTMIGFATAEARKAAVEKFQLWWREHQDQPPYKDLKPLAVPITNSGNPYLLRRGF
jgi:hypothetical protein